MKYLGERNMEDYPKNFCFNHTRHGGNFHISSFLSAGCNFWHRLQLNISLLSKFSHLINDSRQSSNCTIDERSSGLESFTDRADLTLGWISTSYKKNRQSSISEKDRSFKYFTCSRFDR